MNAAPDVQLRLLDLQAVDSTLDQLAHRRRTLPEPATIAELESRHRGAARPDRRRGDRGERPARAQTKADQDVEQVRQRADRDQRAAATPGRVGSAKELENLQHEIASLARRQSELEDVELEVMERLEDARAALAGLTGERESRAGRARPRSSHARDAAFAELDGERQSADAERDRLAAALPADLSKLYEKLRADHGGVGAARLYQGRCEGCRMELTPVDIGRIRDAAPDAVLRCEECRRILVRTAESGLSEPACVWSSRPTGLARQPRAGGVRRVVRDADTGEALVELAELPRRRHQQRRRVLRAGRRAARRVTTSTRSADVEVRMDSKLVVEQMSGRWKIKHEDMRRLALQARDAAARRAGHVHLGAARGATRPPTRWSTSRSTPSPAGGTGRIDAPTPVTRARGPEPDPPSEVPTAVRRRRCPSARYRRAATPGGRRLGSGPRRPVGADHAAARRDRGDARRGCSPARAGSTRR